MCGIVGITGPREVGPLLIEGLKRLEYRGYDSAGIATLSNGGFTIHRSPGKLGNLVEKLSLEPAVGTTGIGHTRWATHGRPTELNAHPQTDCTGQIVVAHNGIFENFAERKAALAKPAIVSTARPTPRSSRTRSRPPSRATSTRRCARR